jgi:hypothetical protein
MDLHLAAIEHIRGQVIDLLIQREVRLLTTTT